MRTDDRRPIPHPDNRDNCGGLYEAAGLDVTPRAVDGTVAKVFNVTHHLVSERTATLMRLFFGFT